MLKKSLFSVITLLATCAFITSCNKYVAETDAKIETTLERLEEYTQQATIPDLPQSTDTVRIQNDIWLGNESVKIMEGEALPAWLEQDDGITLAIAKEASLTETAQQISDLTGIPVRLDDLNLEATDDKAKAKDDGVSVRYSGKLSGLLNYLANRHNVYWHYKDKMISFFKNETRVFTIYALPTETTLSTSLTGATMGENAGGGNASSSLSTSANLSLWESIEEGVKQVVGENGQLSFSRVAGTISITASPYMISKVAKYVATWNEKLSRQVAITVRILQVTLKNEDSYGLDLAAAFNTTKLSLSTISPFTATTEAGSLLMSIVDEKSKFRDSSSIIKALSTQGKTRQLTSSSVTTMNNKVAPVQITTSENYLKEINVTTSGSGEDRSTETDMETDTLTYGFTMDILPRILDHGRLIIMFSITMTDLLDMQTVSSASNSGSEDGENDDTNNDTNDTEGDSETSTVMLPKMSMRGFMQEVAMRSGSTLVLTGFEQLNDQTRSSGVGKAKMGLLGGEAYNKNDRTVLVILLTPEVLQSPLSQEALMRDY